MRALVVVDLQNDFLPGGLLPVPGGDEIIPVINELQKKFQLVVATQDWHPKNHSSFASQHPGKESFQKIEMDGKTETLWPDHCVQGTPGADFSPEWDSRTVEAVFRKGTDPQIDSYSGFYDNHHKKSTGLADYLRGKNVEEVYLCGLAADICVYFTALDSLKEGFSTTLLADATRALSAESFAKACREIEARNGTILVGKEL